MFVNDEKDLKKELNEKDFGEKAKLLWFSGSKTNSDFGKHDDAVKNIYKLLKKRGVTEGTDDEYVKKAYYTIRSKTLYTNWSDLGFAKVFGGLLEQRKLKYQVVATSSNVLSNINNVAFTGEIVWVIKYNNKYYSNPNEHLNPAEIPLSLNGNKVITFGVDSKSQMVTEVLPLSDTAANFMHFRIKASLSPDNQQLYIDQNLQASGLVKAGIIDDVLAFTPFMEVDYKNYGAEDMFDGVDEKSKTKMQDEFNAQKKEWKEEKAAFAKSQIEDEYNHEVVGEITYKVVQDGRSFKKQALLYNQNFSLASMTAKAGDDIVLSIPSLLGNQSQIRREERSRQNAVDVGYPRSTTWEIVFVIPAGYTVEGWRNCNRMLQMKPEVFTAVQKWKAVIW